MKLRYKLEGINLVNNNASEQNKDATLNDVLAVLQSNQDTFDQILMWLKISGTDKVKALLNSALDTPEKKIVYHLSDNRSGTEVNAACGVSQATISRYWNSWHKLGLMKTQKVKGGNRYIKNFDLRILVSKYQRLCANNLLKKRHHKFNLKVKC